MAVSIPFTAGKVLIGLKTGVNGCAVINTSTSFLLEKWATVVFGFTSAKSSSSGQTFIVTNCGQKVRVYYIYIHTGTILTNWYIYART